MPDHKRPQPYGDRGIVVMLVPGLWAEVPAYVVDTVVNGVKVTATLSWDNKAKDWIIDSLAVDRAKGVIDSATLRSITVPLLVEAQPPPEPSLWIDEGRTERASEERLPDESLEQWAARLFYMCTITKRSPAEFIAEVQGITPGSASQRLTTARKMGLLYLGPKARQRARSALKQQRRAH